MNIPSTLPRYFYPDSVFWRVNREMAVALGGGRALLLELAHPLVAAGVTQHSRFKQSPVRRLYRTARVVNDLVFGGAAKAREALRAFGQCHQPVQGALVTGEGGFPAGTKYSAQDPALKFWVFATLMDSAMLAYGQFVRPLTLAEKRSYYLDSQILARLFGIPFSLIPDTYDEFDSYMRSMLAGETLQVGETAQALVQDLLTQRGLRGLARLLYFCGAGMLPPKWREAYGILWSRRQQTQFEQMASRCRRLRARLPDVACVNPRALWAEWQIEHDAAPRSSPPGERNSCHHADKAAAKFWFEA